MFGELWDQGVISDEIAAHSWSTFACHGDESLLLHTGGNSGGNLDKSVDIRDAKTDS